MALLFAALTLAAGAQAGHGCSGGDHGAAGYGYAGHQAAAAATGIRATITAASAPTVRDGHVAGWVGVGGPGAGPGGTNQWLQVGIAALPGAGTLVYAEIARPGAAPAFRLIELDLPARAARIVAVAEVPGRTDWWQASVDGTPVTKPIHLPGFHGKIRPIATGESWDGGSRACNSFAFRFERVVTRTGAHGWRPFTPGFRFQDRGFAVRTLREAAAAGRELAAGGPAPFAFLASTR